MAAAPVLGPVYVRAPSHVLRTLGWDLDSRWALYLAL